MKRYEDLDRIVKNVSDEYDGFDCELKTILVTHSVLRKVLGKYNKTDIEISIKNTEGLCSKTGLVQSQ